ncbi:hypothetical protein L1987_66412 [Smallanthus sonchifolius]|uniref:Uncharacterized protein n=1 Tax=Smallanthus sonchifolius TaxID=185202 RepID=A0ACB9BX84_9ASTR|nr:hypothetical protein L1987_66412 [Smallanthus sonchifolius]
MRLRNSVIDSISMNQLGRYPMGLSRPIPIAHDHPVHLQSANRLLSLSLTQLPTKSLLSISEIYNFYQTDLL